MDALTLIRRYINLTTHSLNTPLHQAGLDDWNLVLLICEWEEQTSTRISQLAIAHVKTIGDLEMLLKESVCVTT